jgi:hypothetical protein
MPKVTKIKVPLRFVLFIDACSIVHGKLKK